MNDLERKIKEAAEKSAKDYSYANNNQSIAKHEFVLGATSPEAKSFHTQGLYTGEEVNEKIEQVCSELNAKWNEIYKAMDDYVTVLGKAMDDAWPTLQKVGYVSKRAQEGKEIYEKLIATIEQNKKKS